MGGVAGALAVHADEVLATFTAPDQKLARAVFQRLVTPERTRAIVDKQELRDISPDVEGIIGRLVEARLLVVQTRGDSEGAVELVHESLIRSWPTLQRWLDENQEHVAYLHQIAITAKQWETKGRPQGLLWTGEAMDEARLFRARFQGELPPRERDFLDAVNALATRATRRKRKLVLGAMSILTMAVFAMTTAFFYIREQNRDIVEAKGEAVKQAQVARAAKRDAEAQAEVAKANQDKDDKALEDFRAQEAATVAARKSENIAKSVATASQATATKATRDKAVADKRAAQERARAEKLEAEKQRMAAEKAGQISTDLK
jgi:hypothetical protein